MHTIAATRPSPIAGRWYESDPRRLTHQIDTYLAEAVLPPLEGHLLAVVAPHAGHRYSGRTAAYAFKAAAGREYDLIAVVSPLHGYHSASILTSAHQRYATPLGEIPIDAAAVKALSEHLHDSGQTLEPLAYDDEHSLEIELPFLQRVLTGGFSLLPVMVRSHAWPDLKILGAGLEEIARQKKVLLVASSDLSHFFPERTANALDQEMLNRIVRMEPESVLSAEGEGAGFACGVGAITAVMTAAIGLGGNFASILHHSTSGDETGDHASVVGYGAVAILKRD